MFIRSNKSLNFVHEMNKFDEISDSELMTLSKEVSIIFPRIKMKMLQLQQYLKLRLPVSNIDKKVISTIYTKFKIHCTIFLLSQ